MTRDEYLAERQRIIDMYAEEIADHESAGCFGDADSARKWMRRKLDLLERDYNEFRRGTPAP